MAGKWETHLAADGVTIDAEKAQADFIADQANAEVARLRDVEAELRRLLEEAQVPDVEPPPPPPPDPITQMWVGSSLYRAGGETQPEGYERRCSEWGVDDLELVRFFFDGMPTGWPQFGTANTVVSFKPPSVKDFGAGKYDTQIANWLNALPRDKKVRRVAIYHEREDNIEAGQFTHADARAMDARMRKLIDEANSRNGTKITFGIILMGWTLDSRSGRNIDNYLKVDFKYDWIGWDAYAGNSFGMDLPDLEYTKALFGRCKAATENHGAKNWYICETGTSNKGHPLDEYDTMQAKWITGGFGVARDLGCKGIMYWDSVTGTGQANNYQIQGPKAKAAMGAEIKK